MDVREIAFSGKLAGAVAIVETLKGLEVRDAKSHSAVGEFVNSIRKLEKDLETEYKEHPAVVEAKEIQRIRGDISALLEGARKSAKNKMIAYEDAEERRRRMEEARLQALAKKQAEDEALAEAARAEKSGKNELANEILSAPIAVPTVVIPKETPKIAGHTRRLVRKFRVDSASAVKPEFQAPDLVKIGQIVRAMGKPAEVAVGGISVWEETV